MKLKIFISIIILLIALFIVQPLIFKTKENELQTKILNRWENNKFIKVIDLLEKPYDRICVIGPYGFKVEDNSDSNEIFKINEYLKKIGYENNEGTWTLLMSDNNNIELFEFHRGEIDISFSHLKRNITRAVPARNCIKPENGYFYLFTDKERKYIILGDKK